LHFGQTRSPAQLLVKDDRHFRQVRVDLLPDETDVKSVLPRIVDTT